MKSQKGIAYENSKRKAMTMLKRRKMYEDQLNNITNQQFNVDQMQFSSETIQNTIDTVVWTMKLCIGRSAEGGSGRSEGADEEGGPGQAGGPA